VSDPSSDLNRQWENPGCRVFGSRGFLLPALGTVFLILGLFPSAGRAETITLQLAGDIMLAGSAEPTFLSRGYDHPFIAARGLLQEADLNIANLEGPITDGGALAAGKQYTFRMRPEAAETIRRAGFGLVSLANNHILDYGAEGLSDTLAHLGSQGVGFAGAGMSLAEARRPARITVKGVRIAFLAYSLTWPESFYASEATPGTAFGRMEYLEEDIPAAAREADLVIVSFHWGQELSPDPKPYQVHLAHRSVQLGADLVFGHHPHVLQGIEIYRGVPILYSLGNFAFGSYSANVRDGMIARLILKTGSKPAAGRIEIIPLNVFNPEVDVQPRPLSGESARRVIGDLSERSAPFGTAIVMEGDRGAISLQ
jgi:poly-gamma-glutamate synthesis protein (capsule biosynthesis protein)